jgi:hypothetical protein
MKDAAQFWLTLKAYKPEQMVQVGGGLAPPVISSIDGITEAFEHADPATRREICDGVDISLSFLFVTYAAMSAGSAVELRRPQLLRRGLLALSVENGKADFRDSIRATAALYNSARKLPGVDGDRLLEEIGSLSCSGYANILQSFGRLTDDQRSLSRFGLKESYCPFHYESSVDVTKYSLSGVQALIRRIARLLRSLPVVRQMRG